MNDPTSTAPRIAPLEPPFSPEADALLRRLMPKDSPIPPIALFRTLAVHLPLAEAMRGVGSFFLGARGPEARALPSRAREIVIHRVCALAGCAYEWGVHATIFGPRVGLGDAELASTAGKGPEDACWSPSERALLRVVDALHARARVDDGAWNDFAASFSPAEQLEVLVLAGWYRAIAYVANATRVPCEAWARAFPG
jgi:alkylhydroperoxidase family enzyme